MPRSKPIHHARLETRLPTAMLRALKWTAEQERLPLSDFVRNALNEHCYSTELHESTDPPQEVLVDGPRRSQIAARPLAEDAERWRGGRSDQTRTLRRYTDLDGKTHIGSLPPDQKHEQDRQDLLLDRAKAREELGQWLKRWGREEKTLRLTGLELRWARRLLASFDRDPE